MGRPKIGVTLNNLYAVKLYFKNALHDGRLWDTSPAVDYETIIATERSFKVLLSTTTKGKPDTELCTALQNWIDTYVPKEKWERCLKTLRQHTRRKKYQMRRLDLPEDIYFSVKYLAERLQLSLAATIHKIVKIELDRSYAVSEK